MQFVKPSDHSGLPSTGQSGKWLEKGKRLAAMGTQNPRNGWIPEHQSHRGHDTLSLQRGTDGGNGHESEAQVNLSGGTIT